MDLRHPFQVVTAALDGLVLEVLCGGDLTLSGREISRRAGASQEGVRVALERLVRQGIVRRDQAGPAHLYRLNREHLAAKWIEGLAGLRLELIRALRSQIGALPLAPLRVVLFGSVARGDAQLASDIDLLVVRPKNVDADDPTWRAQLGDLESFATSRTGNDARVLEYGELEYGRLRGREPALRAAERQGVELYRRDAHSESRPGNRERSASEGPAVSQRRRSGSRSRRD